MATNFEAKLADLPSFGTRSSNHENYVAYLYTPV